MTRLLMTTDAVGGVWQYSTELACALVPHGIETILAVLGPARDGSHAAPVGVRVIDTGLPLDWLASDADTVAAAGEAIAALGEKVGADIVQLNSPALAARSRFTVPVVAVAHGCIASWWQGAHDSAPPPEHGWHGAMMAAGLAAADVVVAPSRAFAGTVQSLYDLPSLPLVVHNGRTAPVVSATAPVRGVFTAGRLWDAVKDTSLLDRVAAQIDLPFCAAGPLRGPHGETVTIHHLDPLGTLDDVAIVAQLAAQPIYVSAARFEPFGLSVLEAAAAGCPLILSDIDTFRELWTGAALLVPERTPEAYAAAIARVDADPALRKHLGEAARARAGRYTPAAMAGAMASIYASVPAQAERAAA